MLQGDLFSTQNSAPLTKTSGARVAQEGAPLTAGPPKGSGGGASVRHCARLRGAAVPQPPSRVGPKTTGAKIQNIIDELKSIAAQRAKLSPSVEAHRAIIGNARERLRVLHEDPHIGDIDAGRAAVLALHNKILGASETYGRDVCADRRLAPIAADLTRELEKLRKEAA